MRVFIAKTLADLQQKVTEKCLFFAERETDQKLKEELLAAAKQTIKAEKVFLVHIPRD